MTESPTITFVLRENHEQRLIRELASKWRQDSSEPIRHEIDGRVYRIHAGRDDQDRLTATVYRTATALFHSDDVLFIRVTAEVPASALPHIIGEGTLELNFGSDKLSVVVLLWEQYVLDGVVMVHLEARSHSLLLSRHWFEKLRGHSLADASEWVADPFSSAGLA